MRALAMIARLAAVSVLAAGCNRPPPVITRGSSAERTLDRARLDYISMLTTGRAVDPARWERWLATAASPADIVDELLADPFVADRVAASVLFRNNLLRPARSLFVGPYLLSTTAIGGDPVLHLGRPCAASAVVTVNPWWAIGTEVKVCGDDLRADVWETRGKDGRMLACDTDAAGPAELPGSRCGCGPNLLRCFTARQEQELASAAIEEVRATAAHVVSNDLPLASLFTMQATVRTHPVELLYLRSLAEGQRLADPAPIFRAAEGWPSMGKLASRPQLGDEQHAGVLTGPQFIYQVFDRRQRMRMVYESMWCAGESAPGALPEDLFAIHSNNLSIVNDGWKELAGRPVCTACHARLDYGMQFFRGYSGANVASWHYANEPAAGRGPLYGAGIDDPRGEGPLDPRGFAQLATIQPEFARCMARAVAGYVFGVDTSDQTIAKLAASAAPTELRFRAMLRAALLDLLACESCAVPGQARLSAVSGSRTLADLVGEHCAGCHGAGGEQVDLERELDRGLRGRVVDQVLFGRMPPDGPLPLAVRHQFLVAAMPASPARSLLRARADPAGALPLVVAREVIQREIGGEQPAPALNTLEVALDGRDNTFTPSYAAITAIDAYRRCGGTGEQRARCVDRITDELWRFTAPPAAHPPELPR